MLEALLYSQPSLTIWVAFITLRILYLPIVSWVMDCQLIILLWNLKKKKWFLKTLMGIQFIV